MTKPAFFVTSGPSRLGRLANPLEMPLAERENEEEVCMSYVINYVIFQNPIPWPVLNFFQDRIQHTILRVLTPICNKVYVLVLVPGIF